jgi:hypothetical protein
MKRVTVMGAAALDEMDLTFYEGLYLLPHHFYE